jgi:hypothetical protein
MQQAGTRQGAHRRAPARHLPAGRLALCRSLHTAITRFLGRFSWSCGYKAQAAIEQKLEPTLFGSTLDKSRQSVQCYRCRAVPKLTLSATGWDVLNHAVQRFRIALAARVVNLSDFLR